VPTHPITHNNKLTLFICGEEGFADIAEQIKQAKESIDLCCWGFDPGMELVRGNGGTWPRGDTYGDLLIDAAKRGVTVRLMVWFDALGCRSARNMPGYSHGKTPWRSSAGYAAAEKISARNSLSMLQASWKEPRPFRKGLNNTPIKEEQIPMLAREEYCYSWYDAAFKGLLSGISVRKRNGSVKDVRATLATEKIQPAGLSEAEIERDGMVHLGTHHQKPILIDFAYEDGKKAVGYVMGLNSVTDYWDTSDHKIDNPRREQGGKAEAGESVQGKEGEPGFSHMKPYQDYACRIDGGKALIALYNNFTSGWDRASASYTRDAAHACLSKSPTAACLDIPSALLRKAEPGDSTVQIVRTQPEDRDKSIKDIYFQATDMATLAGGYLYLENQYFQYEEWAQRLMQKRKDVIAGWKRGSPKAGKSMRDMPIMHVFIVIPVPERAQMIPRTYDTLATLGHDEGMTGQNKLIKDANEKPAPTGRVDEFGVPTGLGAELPPVVSHANNIVKPDNMMLENTFGLKVSVAMLQTCDIIDGHWRYREIYIHSKLLLVDDGFLTLGSANLNQRSMAVDSEINIATDDPGHARDLRTRIWMQQSGGTISGGSGTKAEIVAAFRDWGKLMISNRKKKNADSEITDEKKMTGFLLPFEDNRSSTIRLG